MEKALDHSPILIAMLRCAKCDNAVERFDYLAGDPASTDVAYRVSCHGEQETVALKQADWERRFFSKLPLTFFAGSDPPAGGEREGRGT